MCVLPSCYRACGIFILPRRGGCNFNWLQSKTREYTCTTACSMCQTRQPKEQAYQFERIGYFCKDSVDSTPEQLVFNRTIGLRDTWDK